MEITSITEGTWKGKEGQSKRLLQILWFYWPPASLFWYSSLPTNLLSCSLHPHTEKYSLSHLTKAFLWTRPSTDLPSLGTFRTNLVNPYSSFFWSCQHLFWNMFYESFLSIFYWYAHCCCSVSQLRPTLCDPMDYSPPGSSVHGILLAKILEWVAISFSRGSSPPRDRTGSPALQADSLPSEPPGKPLARRESRNKHSDHSTYKTIFYLEEIHCHWAYRREWPGCDNDVWKALLTDLETY